MCYCYHSAVPLGSRHWGRGRGRGGGGARFFFRRRGAGSAAAMSRRPSRDTPPVSGRAKSR